MSMTEASAQYFGRVADEWDVLRSGYFGESLRDAAIAQAYLRPEMVVADVGAGTGFMAAGLAPLVREVIVLDGSPEMLQVARRNLGDVGNVSFRLADGEALPLEDASVDAAVANMFLHHCPDPRAALREMARILRPGGRLVVTDLDLHAHDWLHDEMADVWPGFDRRHIRAWLREAGLVNVLVGGSGETCCAESTPAEGACGCGSTAEIGIFIASGARRVSGAREAVRDSYGARAAGQAASCCTPVAGSASCCGSTAETASCCAPAAEHASCCGSTAEASSCCAPAAEHASCCAPAAGHASCCGSAAQASSSCGSQAEEGCCAADEEQAVCRCDGEAGAESCCSSDGSLQIVRCCGDEIEVTCCAPAPQTTGCCAPAETASGCCGAASGAANVAFETGYAADQLAAVPAEAAAMALGCGNPTALASLRPGEVVLDIGSGSGIDAFYAARRVGTTGRVIGLDMTPAMIERATRSALAAGLDQVEFRLGHAEEMPVEEGTVDVILSNCVINLCEDKGRVFEEAFRVLKPGGRLSISDMVSDGPLPLAMRSDPQQWAGCVCGALPEREYLDLLADAGFTHLTARRSDVGGVVAGVRIYSLAVTAHKPAGCGCCG